MKRIPHFLILILMIISCSSTEPKVTIYPSMNTTTTSINNLSKRTFLALGDSYTIGESVEEKDRWSVQLIDLLKGDFEITKHDIIARTGWTTEELTYAINAQKLTEQYDIVSLLIGVNNQYRGQSLEKYRTEFKELLDISTKLAKNDAKKVFVLSIPDWGVTPFAGNSSRQKIATEIDAFNAVAKEECNKANIVFIDITWISRNNTGASMIASDQLHFSGKMYALWASEALKTAKIILKE